MASPANSSAQHTARESAPKRRISSGQCFGVRFWICLSTSLSSFDCEIHLFGLTLFWVGFNCHFPDPYKLLLFIRHLQVIFGGFQLVDVEGSQGGRRPKGL
jgi:hypothetical protein